MEALKSYSCENGPKEKKGLDGKLEMPCKKLAYISPLPPEKSGVANYSNDLLQSLKKFYEIHLVFITQYKAEERPKILDDFVHVSVDQFKASYSTYDRILYHFGNSSFHLSYFDY